MSDHPGASPPSPPPPGQAPPPPPPGSRYPPPPPGAPGAGQPVRGQRWPVTVRAVVVEVALVMAFVVARRAGDGGDGALGGRGGDPVMPIDADMEPASSEELRRAIDETSAFVARERGLEFTEPVDIELADGEEFERRLLEDFDEDADELR